jgi:ATP-dependent DNA helicase RecQ
MQYQAGYLLDSVREHLKSYAKQHKKEAALNGLYRSLSTFNIETALNLETPSNIPSILAVAANILTRGLPTLASIHMEEYFSKTLNITTRVDEHERGKISFSLTLEDSNENGYEKFYKALHVIDPRAKDRVQYLDVSNLDSSFERNFLLHLIPESHAFLAQLIEKQRSRSSFTRDNNQGRIDFSLEIPYDYLRNDTSKFRQKVELKHHKIYVVEVDGERYHTDLLDDLKDFEIAQLSTTVKHIKEDSVHINVNEFIQSISSEEYVKAAAENFIDRTYLTNPFTALTLSPFGVARLQRIFLQFLIANYETIIQQQTVKIAVVERDLPCAYVAFDDLIETLNTLNDLAQTQITLPKLEIEVFATSEFINHSLHAGKQVNSITSICSGSWQGW